MVVCYSLRYYRNLKAANKQRVFDMVEKVTGSVWLGIVSAFKFH